MLEKISGFLGNIETLIYVIASILLALTAFIIFGYSVIIFFTNVIHGNVIGGVITLLEDLLLALMCVELLYTVMVSIETKQLQPEPFLVVGLVAAIRRILTLSVEAASLFEADFERFNMALYEIGLLAVVILILIVSIYILRKSGKNVSAQRP